MTLPFRPSLRGLIYPTKHLLTPSTSDPAWFAPLRDKLLETPLPPIYDRFEVSQARKLTATLSSYLPEWASLTSDSGVILPLSHHQIYFNPALPNSALLPDGTDTLQSPGDPFSRRMWAGGTLKLNFALAAIRPPKISDKIWVCHEKITDVTLRGGDTDNPKIFVQIERKFAEITAFDPGWSGQFKFGQGNQWEMVTETKEGGKLRGVASLMETRNLVFMKQRPAEELEAARQGKDQPLKYLETPTESPDFAHEILPDPALLFRYSALTFNAHKIHLDPAYTLNVEGHRNLLVHGPLTLTFMLTLLHHHLRNSSPNEVIRSVHYRNLAPLYCNEPMRICGRKKYLGDLPSWDIWIEGPTGGVAVKGTCRTAMMSDNMKKNLESLKKEENKFAGRSLLAPGSLNPFLLRKASPFRVIQSRSKALSLHLEKVKEEISEVLEDLMADATRSEDQWKKQFLLLTASKSNFLTSRGNRSGKIPLGKIRLGPRKKPQNY